VCYLVCEQMVPTIEHIGFDTFKALLLPRDTYQPNSIPQLNELNALVTTGSRSYSCPTQTARDEQSKSASLHDVAFQITYDAVAWNLESDKILKVYTHM